MTRRHGELESQVLDAIWSLEESGQEIITSSDVLNRLDGSESIALTTVLTILSRLSDKELITRTKTNGRTLSFRSVRGRTEQAALALIELIEMSENPELVVSHFVGSLPRSLQASLRQKLSKNK
jgi:predicted transcriptional regulator